MTIAYPLTRQSDYTELMYSLRSVEKYLPGYEVLIIGGFVPNWITNITQIELEDTPGRAQISVRTKILAALEYSDEILFMNDDIYFLHQMDVPYYHNGDLKSNSVSGAKKLIEELKAIDKPMKNFELHYPIIYKRDFKDVMPVFTSSVLNRSAYCNYLGIEGETILDCKILNPMKPREIMSFISGRECFSTGANSLPSIKPILQELFPDKSKYEI